MLIVNSLLPAMNSRVPSSGSTSQKHFAAVLAQNRDACLSQRALDRLVRRTVGGGDGAEISVVLRQVVIVAVFVDPHYGGSGTYCGIERMG